MTSIKSKKLYSDSCTSISLLNELIEKVDNTYAALYTYGGEGILYMLERTLNGQYMSSPILQNQ